MLYPYKKTFNVVIADGGFALLFIDMVVFALKVFIVGFFAWFSLAVASLTFADGIGTTTATSLITSNIGDFAVAALAVLTAIIGVAVGLLVFRWGWRKIRGVAH